MYMSRKTYVKNWDHTPVNNRWNITVENISGIRNIKTKRISSIVEEIGYWRKAHYLHQWFVENIQNNVDDCSEYYFPSDMIKELANLCKKVLDKTIMNQDDTIYNPDELKEIWSDLNGQDFNRYLYNSIKYTHNLMLECIKEGGDFYYQSSW